MNDHSGHPVLKLFVIIIDRDKTKRLTDLLQKQHVRFLFLLNAEGTANSEILDLLGLGGVEKSVVLCLEPDFRIGTLTDVATNFLDIKRPGKGILFTIPLSGVSGLVSNIFNEEIQQLKERWISQMEQEMEKIRQEAAHDLIVAVINQGFSDDLMSAAREEGATGGTIIHARRAGTEDIVKLFGISLQEEKEIVLIVTRRDNKKGIMTAINKACGMKTEAQWIVFSLPVDSLSGLNLPQKETEA